MSLPSPLSPISPVTACARGWSRAGLSALVGAAAALTLLPAGPAAAHSELVGSTPATGAQLNNPPTQVTFTFNRDVSTRFASTALSVDDAASGQLATRVEGRDLVADVPADLPDRSSSSTWQVAYRVVSADGHPISGTVSFTVAGPTGEPGPAPTATARQGATPPVTPTTSTATTVPPASAAGPGNAQPASKTSVATLLWLSLGAFVLVVGVGAAVWRSQDRSTPGPETSGRQPPQA